MVWAVLALDGWIFTLVCIEKDIMVNTQVELKTMEEYVLHCVTESFQKGDIFTTDCTPFHTEKATQQWYKTRLTGF